MVIKRIGVLSMGKAVGIVYAAVGLLAAVIWGGIVVAAELFLSGPSESGPALVAALLCLVLFPFAYGAFGFIGSLVMSQVYNWVVPVVGGIELDLE